MRNERHRNFLLRLCALNAMLNCSCLAHETTAGADADSSIAAVRTQIRDLSTALVQVKTDLRAGGDVNQNDKWTLRLLGAGVLLLGLSYPIGKVVWLATLAVSRRAAALHGGKPQPLSATGDFFAFREPRQQPHASRANTVVRA